MIEKGKVLLVDDDENIRKVFSRALEDEGYACATALDGQAGLKALHEVDFDVVLVDLKMPEMDGIELVSAIQDSDLTTVPVILSGHGDISTAVEALNLGAFDFLEKPSDPEAVLHAIGRAATHGRAVRHARRMANLAEEWETTFDATPDSIVILDTDQRILRCNQATADRIGTAKEDLVGQFCYRVLCGSDRSPDCCPFAHAPVSSRCGPVEFHHPVWDGHFELVCVPLNDRTGECWGSVHIAHDVTERKRSEEELRRSQQEIRFMATRLAELEETEKRRLARELHDQVGQSLTALGINLSFVRSQLSTKPERDALDRLDDAIQLVEETADRVRDVMSDLRPAVLDDYGLPSALNWYCKHYSERIGIDVDMLAEEPASRLSPEKETAMFRIAQEALTNVAKHSKANRVTVTFEKEDSEARLTIADNGVGFDPQSLGGIEKGRNLGLLVMRERATAVGGEVRVESEVGKGTRVIVEVGG